MFGLFRSSPVEKLNKKYNSLLQQAMEAQRSGDIRRYSELSEQADLVLKEIQEVEKGTSKS